jgi:hypothetical protein
MTFTLMRRCFAHIESSYKVNRTRLCLKQLAARIHTEPFEKYTDGPAINVSIVEQDLKNRQ